MKNCKEHIWKWCLLQAEVPLSTRLQTEKNWIKMLILIISNKAGFWINTNNHKQNDNCSTWQYLS
jgi:hypothetical protein